MFFPSTSFTSFEFSHFGGHVQHLLSSVTILCPKAFDISTTQELIVYMWKKEHQIVLQSSKLGCSGLHRNVNTHNPNFALIFSAMSSIVVQLMKKLDFSSSCHCGRQHLRGQSSIQFKFKFQFSWTLAAKPGVNWVLWWLLWLSPVDIVAMLCTMSNFSFWC